MKTTTLKTTKRKLKPIGIDGLWTCTCCGNTFNVFNGENPINYPYSGNRHCEKCNGARR